ncbi:MAG: hypothetical protein JRI68_16160 [Deltaproteobacteria bacterium]|nr:hypothetical protein [Deltaproteobacteria bacterium]
MGWVRTVGVACLVVAAGCDSESEWTPSGSGTGGASSSSGSGGSGGIAPGPSEDCGSVRLTAYTAGPTGWCEFDRTDPVLPSSVLDGLTLAIAEPYNGSSYEGASGESCGECWEIDTITATRVVMVHDLCPVQGNPLCAGGHFHFDLSGESGAVLDAGGLDEGQARRVPCPVDGNVFAQINDRNEWGYLRVAFVNHRIPIRSVEFQSAGGGDWLPVERSGGAWHVTDGGEPFAADGSGAVFRLTSAQGEVLETPNVLPYDVGIGQSFDLGAQLTDQTPSSGGACDFEPPAQIYGDGYGGIPEVRWAINPWGDGSDSETSDGCYDGSCIQVAQLGQYNGFHLYYRQPFPVATFATFSIRFRATSGDGELVVAPSLDGERCSETTATVGAEWSEVTVDLATVCAGFDTINGVTVDNPSSPKTLLVDDARFEH